MSHVLPQTSDGLGQLRILKMQEEKDKKGAKEEFVAEADECEN